MTELFTPYKEEWRLNEEEVEKAAELYAIDYPSSLKRKRKQLEELDEPHQQNKLLMFLYAKGIMAAKSSVVRTNEFDELLADEEPHFRKWKFEELFAARTDKLKSALKRLEIIVQKGETSPTRTNLEQTTLFEEFVSNHSEWKANISWVVFRDHKDLKKKEHALVERFQRSGLCYMHACVVMQHYLVAMNNDKQIPMLNMAEYLKKYMPGTHLYEQIWNDKGSDSWEFLRSILKKRPKSKQIISLVNESLAQTDMGALLQEHGPALVSGFCVTEEFITENWQHLGEHNEENFKGRHAMVLVGYREVDGNKRYLLQNWWKTKAYVEVDVDYLLSSDTTIHFIKEKQIEMGDYPASYQTLVECESGIDACENFLPERINK
ncbi:hypothetical protein BC833DRAFT_588216 [Globomyces pollinis-pini]|nr:hypothetical protein BC833DRAFT_588216 [Globomyces pollinis-pini]